MSAFVRFESKHFNQSTIKIKVIFIMFVVVQLSFLQSIFKLFKVISIIVGRDRRFTKLTSFVVKAIIEGFKSIKSNKGKSQALKYRFCINKLLTAVREEDLHL